uniref:helix-hairpin-helix domain-containing protein n=1 Tax=uncultured Sphingomonas sp. TaxID=158754 RepID=UPI0035CA7950
MSSGPQNPNQAIDVMTPITITHVILMVALAVAALAIIWWGTILHRRRKAAQEQVDENFAVAEEHGATNEPSTETLDGAAKVSADVPQAAATPEAEPVKAAAEVPTEQPAADPTPAPTTAIASDLTQIKGLGPKLAATLAEQGITRVEQIATLTPDAATELDAKLGSFRGRMTRDRWVEQAKLLSAGDRAGYEAAFGKLGG